MARKQNLPDVTTWFAQKRDRIENGNAEIIEETMDDAADLMRYNIMTRGIYPKTARYETGKMVNSVGSRTSTSQRGTVQGQFGWLESDREDYFKHQEVGFEHYSTGQKVVGMYALTDAYEWAWAEMKKRMEENVRNA